MKGTIRSRGRDTWQLVYDLPPGPDGKRRQKTETVRGPKKAAQIRLREVLGAVDQGRVADPGKMTVGQYMDEWLAGLTLAPASIARYGFNIQNHVRPGIGHLRLAQLTALHLDAFYREKRETLSTASVANIHAMLGAAMKRACKLGLINRNPCVDVATVPRADDKEVRFLQPAEKVRFIEAAKGTRHFAMLVTALATGMRLSELRGLQWRNVDLTAGVIYVRRSADHKNNLVDRLKTKKSRRSITIPSSIIEMLQTHKKHLLEEKLRLRPIWQDLDLVFPRPDGGVLGIGVINKPLRALCKRAEVDIHFHGLRHTHVADLIAANIHPKVISARAGHANFGITMSTYGHLFADAQDGIAAALEATFRTAL